MTTLYFNARLIDKNADICGALATEGGVITYVGDAAGAPCCDAHIDVGGNILMPALIDMHCHLRDPGQTQKETLKTGMCAALSGGYSTLVAMANTVPVCETAQEARDIEARARALAMCNVIQAAAAGVGLGDTVATDYASFAGKIKVVSNDGKTIFNDDFMRELLRASSQYGFIISTHCQPERDTVNRDIRLLREVGGNLHVGHISRRETLAAIKEARNSGLHLTCEVTPHHIFGYDCDYKVNPPLRRKCDVQALIEGIRDGSIDCFATDHAPHTPEDKQKGAAGISGIEFAASILNTVCAENDIPLTTFSRIASYNPSVILGFPPAVLAVGAPANIVIFDPSAEWSINPDNMISKSHNTPFGGRRIKGRIVKTIIGGITKYEYNG